MAILIVDNNNPTKYDSEILSTNPSGASESYLNMLAVELAKKDKVYFIQRHRKEFKVLNRIRYLPEDYDIRQLSNIENVILQRNLKSYENISYVFPKANVICWLHDFFETKANQNLNITHYESDITFVCLTNWHKNNIKLGYLNSGIKLKNKIEIIPHFISCKNEISLKTNMYDRDKVCFFSSGVKGLESSYRLFKKLQVGKPNLKFYFSSPSYDNVEYNFNDSSVINLGGISRDDILSHLSTSICLFAINFNYPETFGCIFKEANLVGTPVLTTPIGSAPEVLSDEQVIYPDKYSADLRGEKKFIETFNKWYFQNDRPLIYLEEKYTKENVLKLWRKIIK
jgi:glycosyltransferase involved in cell wall biosynthesis